MQVIEVIKYDDKVEFIMESWDGTYYQDFTKRYFVYEKNRWDFGLESIEQYFVDYGQRGCLVGYNSDFCPKEFPNKEILVWDLSLIFPDIKFEDNFDYIKDEIRKIANSKTITWYAKKR